MGRTVKGIRNENIKPLNVRKVNQIRNTVLHFVAGNQKMKNETWLDCINAMNQRMSGLKQDHRLALALSAARPNTQDETIFLSSN